MPRSVKTPLLRQLEMRECGAVALGIVLAYYGKYLPLAELRAACGVSRDGVRLTGIVQAARSYGLAVRVFRRETLDGLLPPFIIYWNFNHFLVVEAVTAQGLRVNDPTAGRVYLPKSLVQRYFSGITLTFERTAAFVPAGKPAPLIPKLMLQPASQVYLGVQTARAFLDMLCVAVIVYGLPPQWLLLGLLYAVLWAWARKRLMRHDCIEQGEALFGRVASLPMPFFAGHYAQEIAARLLLPLTELHAQTLDQVAALMRAFLYALALILLSPYFVVAPVLWGLRLLAAHSIEQGRAKADAERRTERARLQQMVAQGVRHSVQLKQQGGEAALLDQVRQMQVAAHPPTMSLASVAQLALDILLMVAASAYLILLVQAAQLAPPLALSGLSLWVLLMSSAQNRVLPALRGFSHQLARLDDVLGNTEALVPSAATDGADGISVSHVSLSMDGHERLSDISFHLKPAQRLAIVGASGSGKTTLLGLLAGFYPPSSGHLRVNQAALALVDGQALLFEGTISDNLRLFDDHIPQAYIDRAVTAVGLADRIRALRAGSATLISPEQHPFSKGELQCFALAQALVRDPHIMLLDEATSALDPLSEHRVLAALAGRTLVIVAHRLSSIRACEEILVLEAGRVAERGTHEALMAAGGLYTRLLAEQVLS